MPTSEFPVEYLRRFELLGTLPEDRLGELLQRFPILRVARGENPYAVDGVRNSTVFLLRGELRVCFADGSSEVLVGACDEALRPLPRDLAEGREGGAITDAALLCIDAHAFDIMLTWDEMAKHAASSDSGETTDWHMLSGAFRLQSLTVGLLAQLPPANIDALLRRFDRIKVKAGDHILREGDPGDYYYLIESGRCEVVRRMGGADVVLAELTAGEAFGEEALVADEARSASVVMRTRGVLLRLGKKDFDELLRAPLLKRIVYADARQRVAGGAVWLDVRFPAEYQQDRLPGAINIPLSEIRNAIGPLDPSREYVVYCQSGRRSSAAAFILSQHGYQAWWLEGGLWGGVN